MEEAVVISIVIVGYNVARHLPPCLDSIYRQSYKNFEVIFVNNGSTDNIVSILKSYTSVKVINNDENKGFCFANNQAIKIAKGDYVLSLNSDVVLDENFLLELKSAAERDDAGLFGAKILKDEDRSIDSTGLRLSWFYRFFDRGSDEIDRGQYDMQVDIFGPCGASALYKKEMLEDIRYNGEYFDEDFFFLGEDFDLAWRAKKRGWKAMFVPKAVCYHIRNSTNFNRDFREFLSFRNRSFLLIKNSSLNFRYLIVFFLYDTPRFLYMLLTNRYACRALYEVIKYRPKMLRKRLGNAKTT
ncbi:glycosyltransferase family 2 protein [Candidatus Omnitrophota bacterium]